jgi:hypothetical protein
MLLPFLLWLFTSALAEAGEEPSITWISKTPPSAPRALQLVFPPYRSVITSGVVPFEWRLDWPDQSKKKKKNRKPPPKIFKLVLERTSKPNPKSRRPGNLKLSLPSRGHKRHIYLTRGEYRWRVIVDKPKLESKWRTFRVIDLKSDIRQRSLSSSDPVRRPRIPKGLLKNK